ncbi:MAG: hypothetical protein SXQ77_11565, partial [Halobacteria archaeon]|nr:hypothetical protein [Halobacteria archaeon]
MKSERFRLKSGVPTLSLLIVSVLTVLVWSIAFARMPAESIDWITVLFNGAFVIMSILGMVFIFRLRIPSLEMGWSLVMYGLLLVFLSDLFQVPELINTLLENSLIIIGMTLTLIGLYSSMRRLQRGLSKSREQLKEELEKSREMKRKFE